MEKEDIHRILNEDIFHPNWYRKNFFRIRFKSSVFKTMFDNLEKRNNQSYETQERRKLIYITYNSNTESSV